MIKITSADYKRAFKDADIRGIYPTEINEELAYAIAHSFITEYGYKKIVVGHDMRLSTPTLLEAFIEGARDAGGAVVSIGGTTSPMLYFASATLQLPGAMITASHSPKDFNGIKLVEKGAIPLTQKTGLTAIRKRVEEMYFKKAKVRGRFAEKNITEEYQKFVFKKELIKAITPMRIGADVGNGMAALLMPLLKKNLPVTFQTLFEELDGNFPNRDSDPCLRKNQRALIKLLTQDTYDFGVGFDGDADRIAFLDEKGRYVNAASIGALIAERIIRTNEGAKIVYTTLCSRIFEETIKEAGGKPVLSRVGHSFLKNKMREKGALFGAEHSGHFFFAEFFNTDSVELTLLYVLGAYSEAKAEGKTFSEMMRPYTIYKQTEDVVIPVADKKVALAKIEKHLEKMRPPVLKKFDGFYVDFGDVWGAIKPSVTEYAIKLMFESKSKSQANIVQKELLAFVQKIAEDTK